MPPKLKGETEKEWKYRVLCNECLGYLMDLSNKASYFSPKLQSDIDSMIGRIKFSLEFLEDKDK